VFKALEFTACMLGVLLLLAGEILWLQRKEIAKLKRIVEFVTSSRDGKRDQIDKLEAEVSMLRTDNERQRLQIEMMGTYMNTNGLGEPVLVYHPDGTPYPESIVIHEEP
jgi:uncharacterized protein (UPF0305 family)